MNTAKKQNLAKSVAYALRYLREAQESLEEASGILQEELEQLYIGRLLTHKKGASDEMFDIGEDKRLFQHISENLNDYIEKIDNIANKYE